MPSNLPVTNTGTTDLQAAISGWGAAADGDSVFLGQGAQEFLSNTDLSAIDLLVFKALAGWSGNFDSSPLVLTSNRTATGKAIIEFSGRIFRMQAAAGPGVINKIEVRPQRSDARVHLSVMDCALLSAERAVTYIESTGDVDKVDCYKQAQVILRASGSLTPTLLRAFGGEITCERDVATVETGVSREGTQGKVYLGNENAAAAVSPATINMTGGLCQLRNVSAVSTKINGYAGVLDFSKLTGPITIADADYHPELTIILGSIDPTYSSGPTTFGSGPRYVRV